MSSCICACACMCMHFTLPCMSNLRVRVTFMPPSPKSCSQFILAAESGAGSRMKEALEIMKLFKAMNSACFSFLFFYNSVTHKQKQQNTSDHPLCLCKWTLKSETRVKTMKLFVHSSGEQGDKKHHYNIVIVISLRHFYHTQCVWHYTGLLTNCQHSRSLTINS